MDSERQCRTAKILGVAACEKLAASRVLLVGVGGVGGYAAEFLVRSGVGNITFVDGDEVALSNCNRQIVALSSTLGQPKVDVIKTRALEINPDGNFTALCRKLSVGDVRELFAQKFDLVIDCIDDTPVKVALIAQARENGLFVVSSMGAAGKFDPTQVEVADIAKTHNCPLARAVRRRLREKGIFSGVSTVFSPETPAPRAAGDNGVPGSLSFVVSAFGGAVASCTLQKLLGARS